MKILITGAGGFVGQALLDYLSAKESQNEVFLLTSKPISGYRCIMHNNYSYDTEDIPEEVDCVLHLGGFIPKNTSDVNDALKHAETVLNTQYLLDHLPKPPQKIVYCSSVEVYGRSHHQEVITENSRIQIGDLYSAAKLMCERLIEKYAQTHRISYHILRLGPIFGPNDKRKNCFLPGILYQAMEQQQIVISVPPQTKRNYLYVGDAVRAIWAAVHRDSNTPHLFNIVSQKNASFLETVETAIAVTNGTGGYICQANETATPIDMAFDNQRMNSYLCSEEESLYTGLQKTYMSIKGAGDFK